LAVRNLPPLYFIDRQPLPSDSDFSHYQPEMDQVPKETKGGEAERAGPAAIPVLTEAAIRLKPNGQFPLSQDYEQFSEQSPLSPPNPVESITFTGNERDFVLAEDPTEGLRQNNFDDPIPATIASDRNDEAEEITAMRVSETSEKEDSLSESPSETIIRRPPLISPQPSSSSLAIFPSLAHDRVGECISFFQVQASAFFARSLARSTAYADMMKKIFREKDLPEELFYLALIESGFNPRAFSKAKASGIWQFVGKTAKRFGLKVDKWIDERRDPEKATYAAADYLKSLYALFNDWDLATAGYNAGEGKILKAVKRAKTQEFWKISQSRFLKKETKEYVPMFLAAVTIAQNPLKYGFQNIEYSPPLVYEKVTVPPNMSLSVIAMAAESDLSHIQALNPALKKGKTPPHSSFEIKLPLGKKEIFENNFPILSPMPASGRKYRVGKGESLRKIAQKHKLTLRALCDLNDLSPKSRLQSGTVLLLPPL
jgi:membrane-bound lytic murein transglycosylase D